MRGDSSKTRIETPIRAEQDHLNPGGMRGDSSKTRIETGLEALCYRTHFEYERRFQ